MAIASTPKVVATLRDFPIADAAPFRHRALPQKLAFMDVAADAGFTFAERVSQSVTPYVENTLRPQISSMARPELSAKSFVANGFSNADRAFTELLKSKPASGAFSAMMRRKDGTPRMPVGLQRSINSMISEGEDDTRADGRRIQRAQAQPIGMPAIKQAIHPTAGGRYHSSTSRRTRTTDARFPRALNIGSSASR